MSLLRHINIPSTNSLPTYALAVEIQAHLQRKLLEYKATAAAAADGLTTPVTPKPVAPPPPPPTLISFTPAPTYTLGRRQVGPLSSAEEQRLRAPLRVRYWDEQRGIPQWRSFVPEVVNAPRGGLATYHGPGQVVFWPVIDLHSPYHRHLTVRDYACLLEKTTIEALGQLALANACQIEGFTTSNPGVWVKHQPDLSNLQGQMVVEERKIAALGVHLRRHVTSLGVAVNVNMPVDGPEETNPWSRIVACGLEDKKVTSIYKELSSSSQLAEEDSHAQEGDVMLRDHLRRTWAEVFEKRLTGSSGRGVADAHVFHLRPAETHSRGQAVLDQGVECDDTSTKELVEKIERQALDCRVRGGWYAGYNSEEDIYANFREIELTRK